MFGNSERSARSNADSFKLITHDEHMNIHTSRKCLKCVCASCGRCSTCRCCLCSDDVMSKSQCSSFQ